MGENGPSKRGAWAVGVLTTVSLGLGSFALSNVIQIREDLKLHEVIPAHSKIDERVDALERAQAAGSRLIGRDGLDMLRIIERLAEVLCQPPGEEREAALKAIAKDAEHLRDEIKRRQY